MAAANKKSSPKRTYSNSSYTSYDNQLSSMSLLHSNGTVSMNLSPILPEMIGKNPERGEQMYDHESNVLFFMTAEMAQDLKSAIARIHSMDEEELSKVKSVTVENKGGNYRAITLFTPGSLTLKLAGKRVDFPDNFVLKFEQQSADSDVPEVIYHQLAISNFIINTNDKENPESLEEVYDVGLEMLEEMLQTIIDASMGAPYHIANLAGSLTAARVGGGSAGSTRRGRRGSVMEEVNDDDDDNNNGDEGEEETTSTRRVNRSNRSSSRSGGGSTRTTRRTSGKSLSEEFSDDESNDGGDEGNGESSEGDQSSGSPRVRRNNRGAKSKSLSEEFSDDDGDIQV